MPKHECETFDFPLAAGVVNYTTTKKLSKKGGGTWQIATQEAIDEARQQAEDDGRKALKNDTCEEPCECMVFVDISLNAVAPTWIVKGRSLSITVTGVWQAGILCLKPHAKGGGKSEDKPSDGKSGGKQDEKKSGDKPKKKKSHPREKG